jgi:hypothetical protein
VHETVVKLIIKIVEKLFRLQNAKNSLNARFARKQGDLIGRIFFVLLWAFFYYRSIANFWGYYFPQRKLSIYYF